MQLRPTALAAVLSALALGPAQANLLTNGSFEARVVTANDLCQGAAWCVRSNASTPGWTQELDGVDLVHNNYTQGPSVLVDAADGVNFLDMNQTGLLGGISQVVAANVGTLYTLTLQSTAWATNSLGGSIAYSLYDPGTQTLLAQGSFNDNFGGAWALLTLQAEAISSFIGVRITATNSAQAGMGVDNVVLTAVPEPGAAALLLAGLAALGLRRAAARRPATPAR